MDAEKKRLTQQDAAAIAKAVCAENGWPFLEPVAVQPGLFSWTIVTNAQQIGCNVRVRVHKRSGKITMKAFNPR